MTLGDRIKMMEQDIDDMAGGPGCQHKVKTIGAERHWSELVKIGTLAQDPRKFDTGKLKYSLILPEFLELMAEILTKGEVNHPPEPDGSPSWQHVEPERYIDALTRHLQSYRMGESEDIEMGTHHCGHIAVNAMFLWWIDMQIKEGK